MHYLFAMYHFYSSERLVENVESLFDREGFAVELALNCVKIAHVAVLHDQKVPIAVYLMMDVPSKVL
jgi:hypothetical protein